MPHVPCAAAATIKCELPDPWWSCVQKFGVCVCVCVCVYVLRFAIIVLILIFLVVPSRFPQFPFRGSLGYLVGCHSFGFRVVLVSIGIHWPCRLSTKAIVPAHLRKPDLAQQLQQALIQMRLHTPT